jgi:hypothetical protein
MVLCFCWVRDIGKLDRLGRLDGLEVLTNLVQVAFDSGHHVVGDTCRGLQESSLEAGTGTFWSMQ